MNRPKLKPFVLLAIFFFIIGTVFGVVAKKMPSSESILENGGEEVNAIVVHIENGDSSSTTVQIDDEDSFYDGEIIKVGQYSSSLYIGKNITVYYDGENLLLESVASMPVIFGVVGKCMKWIGGIILFIGILKFIIFIAKVGVAGLVVGSVANEVQQQEQFNNQFYGNPQGTTMSPQQYPNRQYDQYGNPYTQQQQTYNQQQQYNQQQYNQQYQQQQQQYNQQNNNNYYNN